MFRRHVVQFLAAKLVPAAVNLGTLLVFTRAFGPEDYGKYAVVVSAVGVFNAIAYWWLRMCVVRFGEAAADTEAQRRFMPTVLSGYLASSTVIIALVVLSHLTLGADDNYVGLLAFAVPALLVLLGQGLFEIGLEQIRSRLRPGMHGSYSTIRALLILVLGGLGYGVAGNVSGALLGIALANAFVAIPMFWPGLHEWAAPDIRLLGRYFSYGMPLALSFGLTVSMTTVDRAVLAALDGAASAGIYSAATEFSQKTVGVLMLAIGLAGFPHLLRASQVVGGDDFRLQARRNLRYLMAVGAAMVTVVGATRIPLVSVLFVPEFHEGARAVLPLAAAFAAIGGLRTYHFEYLLQVRGRQWAQLLAAGIGAVLNVPLTLIGVGYHGAVGAAVASILAVTISLLVAAFLWRASESRAGGGGHQLEGDALRT